MSSEATRRPSDGSDPTRERPEWESERERLELAIVGEQARLSVLIGAVVCHWTALDEPVSLLTGLIGAANRLEARAQAWRRRRGPPDVLLSALTNEAQSCAHLRRRAGLRLAHAGRLRPLERQAAQAALSSALRC